MTPTTRAPHAPARRPRGLSILALAAAAAAAAGCAEACRGNYLAEVGDAVLPNATRVSEAPEGGEVVVVTPDDDAATLPDADPVVLAIDRDVSWGRVRALIDKVKDAGNTPVTLVGFRGRARAFRVSEPLPDVEVVTALALNDDGAWNSCVMPEGARQAKCAQRGTGEHIDRTFTREIVREAVRELGVRAVRAELPADLTWANVVRLVDGARTCCRDVGDIPVEVVPPSDPETP